jgi:hypothetical protein
MVASSAPVTSIFAGIYVLMYALLSLRVALNRLYINFKGKKDVYLDVLAANAGEGLSDEEVGAAGPIAPPDTRALTRRATRRKSL